MMTRDKEKRVLENISIEKIFMATLVIFLLGVGAGYELKGYLLKKEIRDFFNMGPTASAPSNLNDFFDYGVDKSKGKKYKS